MLKILAILFLLSGAVVALAVIIHKLYVSKQKDMMKASHFIASMTIFMGFYILSGIILSVLMPNILYKISVFIFALSPFIIGKFAT